MSKINEWMNNLFAKEKKPTQEQMDHIAKIAKEKEEADRKKEPYIAILNMDVDYDNINSGAFEFEWNDIFIARLMKAGYQGKTDSDLVDQWFSNICRNVVLETWEQEQADLHPTKSRRLEGNRREYK